MIRLKAVTELKCCATADEYYSPAAASHAIVEVADDGSGLNQDKIRAKALERGLIQENDLLSEQDIVNLIFEAGFSTVDKVSNLSGQLETHGT